MAKIVEDVLVVKFSKIVKDNDKETQVLATRDIQQALENDKEFQDEDARLFDADGDGDNDLYVVRGSNQHDAGSSLYQDIICENDGNGNFKIISSALPVITSTGQNVKAADIDNDGDVDFVTANILTNNVSVLKNINNVNIIPPSNPDTTLNWSDPNTWGGTLPTPDNTVTIPNNVNIALNLDSLSSGNSAVGTIILSDSASLQVGGSGELQINGDLVINGSLSVDGSSSPTLQCNGNFLVQGEFNPDRKSVV